MVVPVSSRMAGLEAIIPVPSRLAGLGDTFCLDGYSCGEFADDGTCVSCIPDSLTPGGSSGGSSTTINTSGGFYGTYTPVFTDAGVTPTSASSVTVVSSSVDSYGNVYMALSNGKYVYVSPNGQVLAGAGIPGSSGGTITSAQANAWPALISALTSAGVKLGTVAMLQPGQTLLSNGTILGSGQSLVGGNVVSSANQLGAIFSNPMFLVAGGGLLLVALLAGGR